MSKAIKELIERDLKKKYADLDSAMVVSVHGLSGVDANKVRGRLRKKQIEVHVIKNRAAKVNLANIHTVFGDVEDTRLPPSSVDAVLILKTYHEFEHPIPLMKKLRASLKPGAKIGIIDRNGNGTDHGIMPDLVEHEMSQAGYRRIGKYDFTKDDGQDYFLIFTPN